MARHRVAGNQGVISACLSGRRRSHMGYTFERMED